MKKILSLITCFVVLFSIAKAEEDTFYSKVDLGWTRFTKVKGLKSNNSGYFGVGVGYNMMDDVRLDLTFTHFINSQLKSDTKKVKTNLNSLLVNLYMDVYEVDALKLFVGAGVGGATVRASRSDTNIVNIAKIKQRINLALAGYVGTSCEFTPSLIGEFVYSYRDLDQTKQSNSITALRLRSHNLGFGLRLEL